MINTKLEKVYGKFADLITNRINSQTVYKYGVLEGDTAAAYYQEIDEKVTGMGENIIPVLLFDDVYSPENYIDLLGLDTNPEFTIKDDGVPVAKQNVSNWTEDQFTSWLSSVKTGNTYIMGGKFNRLKISYAFENDNVEEYNRVEQEVCAGVDAKYKENMFSTKELIDMTVYYNSCNIKGYLSIVDIPTGKPVVDFIFCVNELTKTLYAPSINVSVDEEIRKTHRAYIVGHTEMVRLGVKLKMDNVDFMLYLPFKENIGLQKQFFKGIGRRY